MCERGPIHHARTLGPPVKAFEHCLVSDDTKRWMDRCMGGRKNIYFLKGIKAKHIKRGLYYRKLLCIIALFHGWKRLGCALSKVTLLWFQRQQSTAVLHTYAVTCAPRPLRFAPHILVRKVLNDSFCFGTQKRRRTHSKIILHRCKIYSTTGIRIHGNLH